MDQKAKEGRSTESRVLTSQEINLVKHEILCDTVSKILKELFKYGALVTIAICIYLISDTWAGKKTDANINVNMGANIKADIIGQAEENGLYLATAGLGVIFGLAGISYGLIQSRLRREIIERFARSKDALEKRIDPGRTSSGLLPNGDTRPEDR